MIDIIQLPDWKRTFEKSVQSSKMDKKVINCDASYAIRVLVAKERPRSMLTGVVNSIEDPVIFFLQLSLSFH